MKAINKYSKDLQIRDWDSKHFGFKVASCYPKTDSEMYRMKDSARDNKVNLLMVRCDTDNAELVHALERSKFLLMETQVTYSFDSF